MHRYSTLCAFYWRRVSTPPCTFPRVTVVTVRRNSKTYKKTSVQGILTGGCMHHMEGGFFTGKKLNQTPASRQQCSRLQHSRWCRFRFFAAVIYNAFPNNPKTAPSCGWGIWTPSNSGSFGPLESPPNGISIGSAVYAGLTNETNRHTNRQTTLLRLSQCIYAMHAVRITRPNSIPWGLCNTHIVILFSSIDCHGGQVQCASQKTCGWPA